MSSPLRLPALLAIVICLSAFCARAADVSGFVADARGGERLERVRVRLVPAGRHVAAHEAVSGANGEFALRDLPAGDYDLTVSTVGYRVHEQKLQLDADQKLEMEVALSPEAFTQRETIEVTAKVFDPLEPAAPSEQSLTHTEVKNLGSVLADDPLRAVQAMPGVSSNDDFDARFSMRGAGFENVGIFLDGVLLHEPFHTLHVTQASGSLTILNGDMVDNIALMSGGFSARYGDRTAGAVVVTSREGGRLRPTARITASASNAGALAEGPLGPHRRGSWMAAYRKSYLDYIIRRTSSDPSIAFGFSDLQGRAVYDLTERLQASLMVAAGKSGLDRSYFINRIGLGAVMNSDEPQGIATLGLRYLPGPRWLLTGRVAGIHESYTEWNPTRVPLESGRYREYTSGVDASLYWTAGMALELGGELRRIHDEGVRSLYTGGGNYAEFQRYRGEAWLNGGYAQQTWVRNRWRASAGLRLERFVPSYGGSANDLSGQSTYSPRLALAVPLPGNQTLRLGWGQYRQFPPIEALTGAGRNPNVTAEKATHYVAAWEWQPAERVRVNVEVYDREDRHGIAQPWFEPRLLSGGLVWPRSFNTPFENSLVGRSRGFQFLVQRRSANRLAGWVSYAYEQTHARDTFTGDRFPYDYDQRHTFNAYASYRIRPSVNLSARWLVGSGFPVPAYLQQRDGGYFLSPYRNRLRLDRYQRLDLRINKSLLFAKRRLTIYGEVINITNRRNLRFSELPGYNVYSGAAYPRFDRMFPIIPSAGCVYEF